MTPAAAQVLDFWFGAPPLTARAEWFRKDPAFDEQIRARFGALVDDTLAGTLHWEHDALSTLAHILVLDQFTRNLFRGQARAFAGDAAARTLALWLVDGERHLALQPQQRVFAYLPLEHAEDSGLQDRSVALFEALAAAHDGFASVLDYAHRHRDVIRRFGRFPHRNAALGRDHTAEEAAYLAQPGSGF